MGEKIDKIISRPLYLFLYGFSFLFLKISAYPASLSIFIATVFLFSYLITVYFLLRIFKKFVQYDLASLMVFLIAISALHIMGIAQFFGYSYSYIPNSFYIAFYLFTAFILFLIARIKELVFIKILKKLYPLINVFIFFSSIIFFINCFKKLNDSRIEIQNHYNNPKKFTTVKNSKDIVWIILDEYASSISLHQQFSFDNPLDSALKNLGFIILKDIHSSYSNTLFSINSIFNMNDTIVPSSFYVGEELLRHSSLIPSFEKSGYQFTNLSFFNLSEHTMLENRSGYPYTFIQQLIAGTIFNKIYINLKFSVKSSDDYNQKIYNRLCGELKSYSSRPRFIWAHLTIPHEPFCRDEKGNYRGFTSNRDDISDTVNYKKLYINYLKYGNQLILNLLKSNPEIRDKIVIISGDHGPRYPFLKNKDFQKWPFAAIYIPDSFNTQKLEKLHTIGELPEFLISHISKS